MTETRKAIIELIEPYMDKTLSEGCLIKYIGKKNKIRFGKIISCEIKNIGSYNSYITYHILANLEMRDNKTGYLDREEIKEIIGHYDITAVLKYFRKLGIFIQFIDETNEIALYSNKYDYLDGKNSIGRFPKKPLYLYTEEEDKNLLELLQKLG